MIKTWFDEKLLWIAKKLKRFRYARNVSKSLSIKILIDKLLNGSDEDINAIMRLMIDPIKEGIEYNSLARKVLCVHNCVEEFPRYDKDPNSDAFVLARDKTVVVVGNEANVLELPPVQNSDVLEIDLSKIKPLSLWDVFFGKVKRNLEFFTEIDRAQCKVQNNLADAENKFFVHLLSCAGITKEGNLSLSNLGRIYSHLEDPLIADVIVDSLLMHPKTYAEFKNTLVKGDTNLDPTGNRQLILSGYVGDLWSASIRINKSVPRDRVYAFSAPEYLGVIVPHTLVAVRGTVDNPKPNTLYFVFYYTLNMAIISSLGIAQLKITEEKVNG